MLEGAQKEMSLLRACCRSRRIRWALAVLTACLVLLAITDFYFETHGLPESVIRKIERSAEQYGYRMEMDSIRAGIWNGVICSGVRLTGGVELPEFSAERVRVDFAPLLIFQGVLFPFALEINQGYAAFPLFPEFGEEGRYDRLVISDLNASLAGAPGIVEVSRADGSLNGIRFSMQGSIDNLLHYSGAMWINELCASLAGGEKPEKKPLPRTADSGLQPVSPYVAFLRTVPLAVRKKVLYSLQRIHEKQFQQEPSCKLNFRINMTDFKQTTATASFRIPSFRYGGLNIESIQEETSLKDGIISLNRVHLELGDGYFITASGKYDGSGNAATGQVKGTCRIADLLLFLDASLQRSIAENVRIADETVTFEGSLENFSLSSRKYHGRLNVQFPHLNIHQLDLRNVALDVTSDGQSLSATLLNAALKEGGSIQGKFRVADERFEASLKGRAGAGELEKILSPEISRLLRENVILRTPASRTDISFSGSLAFPLHRIRDLSGEFRVRLTDLQVKGIVLNALESNVLFTSSTIRAENMEAVLPDGSRVTGRLFCEPGAKYLSASVVCSGSPGYMINALGKSHKDFVTSLTRDIQWPSAANTVELSADLYADYGEEPFYFLSGSMVIRDFAYQKIPFRYGAARFIIDADNRLILPDVILETADGKMSMSADYMPSGRNLSFQRPDGILNFQLSSSIAGNDMIRALYPGWASEYIDFPYPMRVEANGVLHYGNGEKSHFEAVISNGTCRWQGIRIDDVDATLKYADHTVSFRGGEAHFSKGRLQMDYLYNFRTRKGNVSARLTSANLYSLLENFHADSGTPPDYRNATCSLNLEADMAYDSRDRLLLDGGGSMTVRGSNLWTVPILGSFLRIIGRAWSLENFGSITRISGDFKLEKDRLVFRDLRSDGGLVSLNASGNYRWQDDSFDVRVRAELLRSALPFDAMTHLLTPVSWILERRLQGNFNTYQWE